LGHTSQTTIIWEYLGGFPKMGGPENQRTPYWKWQLLHDQSGSPIKKNTFFALGRQILEQPWLVDPDFKVAD
jgi:hypothetical protein